MQQPEISKFCKALQEGNWDVVEAHIPELQLHGEPLAIRTPFVVLLMMKSVKFILYQQKFLELLEERKLKEALDCLRNRITPLHRQPSKIHSLSRLMMYFSK